MRLTLRLKIFLQQAQEERSFLCGSWVNITLTQSLVIVLCITRQSEQCRSHFLTALVQVLPTQIIFETSNQVSVYTRITLITSPRLSVHLDEFSVALIAGGAVVVLQKLSQQRDAFVHFLDGVHPLWHLLCSLLILEQRKKKSQIKFVLCSEWVFKNFTFIFYFLFEKWLKQSIIKIFNNYFLLIVAALMIIQDYGAHCNTL